MMRPFAAFLLLIAGLTVSAAPWQTHGPDGGRVLKIAAAPTDARVQYVASTDGMFRSSDGGATWSEVSGPIAEATTFAIDPKDADVVIVAGGVNGREIHRTEDGGATWTRVGAGLPPDLRTVSVLIDPRDSNTVYLSSRCREFFIAIPQQILDNAGVFKSIDGGVTFFRAMNGMVGFQRCPVALSLDPTQPGVLYSSPQFADSFYSRSVDGAETWQTVQWPVPGRASVVDSRHPGRLFGIGQGAHLLTSTDSGGTWSRIEFTIDPYGTLFNMTSIELDPARGHLFVGDSQSGLFRSEDDEVLLEEVGGRGREPVHTMLFAPTEDTLTIGTPSGLYRSTTFPWDDWTMVPVGVRSLEIRVMAASLKDPKRVYAASMNRVYASSDGGRTWSFLGNPLVDLVTSLAVDAGETVYADSEGTLYRLPAGASEWQQVPFERGFFIRPGPVADPNIPGRLCVGSLNQILCTRDSGATWTSIRHPLDTSLDRLILDPDDANTFYGVSRAAFHKSTDGGQTWATMGSFVPDRGEAVPTWPELVLSRSEPGTLYAITHIDNSSTTFHRSTDRGETWTEASRLPLWAYALVAVPAKARVLYVLSLTSPSSHVVLRSVNGGVTWTPFGEGLPAGPFAAMAANSNGTILHLATERGMWERSVDSRRRAVRH
jgi:photosystem II stability/assembly factor-like uncharacterized protein